MYKDAFSFFMKYYVLTRYVMTLKSDMARYLLQ